MDIKKEINNILTKHKCACFYFDSQNLIIKHNMTIEEARHNVCNHSVFVEITGLLLKNNIDYEVTDNNDIKIFL